MLARALEKARGNKAAAARALKMPVTTYKRRLARELGRMPRVDVMGDKADGGNSRASAKVIRLADRQPPRARQPSGPWYARGNSVVHDDGKLLELETLPETVLHWSCSQAPFEHSDALPFLSMVKATYNPDMVVCHGDELDLQFLKKAFMGADSDGPIAELSKGKDFIRQCALIFPQMLLLTSNHIHSRQKYAQAQGNIPSIMLRDWRDVIDAPADWTWRDYVIARNWLFEHGHDINMPSRGNIVEQTDKRFGRGALSIMRGHIHSEFGDWIRPIWHGSRQIRCVFTGCLMDKHKVSYTRSPTVNGCIVLYRGIPHAIPMAKDRFDRWVGRLAEW